jgi:hypothetical protein
MLLAQSDKSQGFGDRSPRTTEVRENRMSQESLPWRRLPPDRRAGCDPVCLARGMWHLRFLSLKMEDATCHVPRTGGGLARAPSLRRGLCRLPRLVIPAPSGNPLPGSCHHPLGRRWRERGTSRQGSRSAGTSGLVHFPNRKGAASRCPQPLRSADSLTTAFYVSASSRPDPRRKFRAGSRLVQE